MTRLSKIVIESAEAALSIQNPDGSMPAGHNGPYHDPETPVRNTSHWLVTFLKADELAGDDRFRKAALKAVSYLLSDEACPHGYTFEHRQIESKDRCNGVMGQAWTIEALAVAAERLNHDAAAAAATEVFLLHPFDEAFALWERVEVNGECLGFDRTFNHQLWFAAAGGLVARVGPKEVDRRVRLFLDSLSRTLDVYQDGLIRHPLRPEMGGEELARASLHPVRRGLVRNHLLHYLRPPSRKRALRTKAEGYHSFNLYALSLLAETYPDHPAFDSPAVTRVLDYTVSEEYEVAVSDNEFSFPYNPPGFEIPYALEVFGVGSEVKRHTWVNRQVRHSLNAETGLLTEGTEDPNTQAARLYEATRLCDYELESYAAFGSSG